MQIIETQEMLFSFDSRVGDTLLSTPEHSGLIADQKLNSQETTSMKQKRHVTYVGVYYANHRNLGNVIYHANQGLTEWATVMFRFVNFITFANCMRHKTKLPVNM